MMAVDKRTGDLLWVTQVDSHPASVITHGPFVRQGLPRRAAL
jgi:polyvinyl alcohol dehydrogenase (cytochrome)